MSTNSTNSTTPIQDPFMDNDRVANRLFEEWKEHGNLIIAYDYDNTVYDYQNKGYTYPKVIELLRTCKQAGAYLMVYTACDEPQFPTLTNYLTENNIPFDAINEQPSIIPFKGKKLYYNILLDDRAGLQSAYISLSKALQMYTEYLQNKQNK